MAWLVAAPTPLRDHQRDHAGDERQRRHQNRPQPIAAGLHDGVVRVQPGLAQLVGVIDLQDRVLLHDAEQHQQAEAGEDVQRLPEDESDSSANGSVSGSDSRIVTGCSHDSNCAARIRYMKTSDSRMAERNAVAVRLSSRERPVKPARYSGLKFKLLRRRRRSAAAPRACEVPGSMLAVTSPAAAGRCG